MIFTNFSHKLPRTFWKFRPSFVLITKCLLLLGLLSCSSNMLLAQDRSSLSLTEGILPSNKDISTRSLTIQLSQDEEPRTIKVSIVDGWVLMEGDILLGREADLFQRPSGRNHSREAAVMTFEQGKWPDGIIPFKIQEGYPDTAKIYAAINHVIRYTNICMIPHTTEANYVEFILGEGLCASHIGRIGIEKQPIIIDPDCGVGSTIHEIMHTAGVRTIVPLSERMTITLSCTMVLLPFLRMGYLLLK